MALTPVKRTDPFEFPKHVVPLGLTYQWSAERIMGEKNPQHEKLLELGWVPVPAQWHAPFPVKVKENVLLCHAKARDEEAERIAGAEKNIENWQRAFGGFSGGVRIQQQTADGISKVRTIPMGDPALAARIMPPAAPELPSTPRELLPPKPIATLAKKSWAQRLHDLFFQENTDE
jgi:hypothetical protein